MAAARSQVLADGDDVDADGPEVGQGGEHLVLRSPIPRMIPDLVVSPASLARARTVEAAGVPGRRSHRPLQTGHRLDVVVEHVGPSVEDGAERPAVAFAVRDQHLDGGARRIGRRIGRDGLGEGAGATVGQVVTGDAGDHRVGETHPCHGLAPPAPARRRRAGADGAVSTWQKPQARVQREPLIMKVAVPVGPALVDVGAAGLLAHGDQIEIAQVVLEAEVVVAHPGLDPQPRRLARRTGPARAPGSTPERAGAAGRGRRLAADGDRDRTVDRHRLGRTAPARLGHPLARPRPDPTPAAAAAITASTTSVMVTSKPSAASEVTGLSAIPHGTMWPNIERSVWTLRANPWVVRPRDVRTPMAQILRGPASGPGAVASRPTQTPGYPGSRPTVGGREPERDQRVDDHLLDLADVSRTRGEDRDRRMRIG